MVNFPPVDGISSRIKTVKPNSNRQVDPSAATVSRSSENSLQIDRRHLRDRRRHGSKQFIDRRLIPDRRRSGIDITV